MAARTLIIMRHGKAEDGLRGKDHARHLEEEGRLEARDTAGALVKYGARPEQALVSDAARTQETYAAVAKVFAAAGITPQVEHRREIYSGGLDGVLELIGAVDAGVHCLLLVGHNPSVSEVASTLSGRDCALTTGDAVVLTADADSWTAGAERSGGWKLKAL